MDRDARRPGPPAAYVIPLPLGLLAAVAALAWASVPGRARIVPIACLLALPAVWPISLVMLLAAAAFARPASPIRSIR